MTSPLPVHFLGAAPPSCSYVYDEKREQEDEYSLLVEKDEELSARIEELSGLRPGSLCEQETSTLRRELLFERRKIRARMLAIAPH